jgi:hypothetical protein
VACTSGQNRRWCVKAVAEISTLEIPLGIS